jgi:hypothetical protein
MKKNLRFIGTLLAASLLGAGSASAQTTNNNYQPRGVIGGTLGALGLGGVAQRMYSPSTYNMPGPPRGGLVGGVVGGVLRPVARVGRMGAGAMAGGNSASSSDASLPGLAEADQQMREEAAEGDEDSGDDIEAKADDAADDTADAADDSDSDAGEMSADSGDADASGTDTASADDGMGGAQGSRGSGTTQRTSSDYRGNREQESRVFSVGLQVGRASSHSNEQQVRRGNRTQVRGSEAQYTAPPSGQSAEGSGQASGNETGQASTGTNAPANNAGSSGTSSTGTETASATDSTPTPGSSSSASNASP